jgi:hypothetical protein
VHHSHEQHKCTKLYELMSGANTDQSATAAPAIVHELMFSVNISYRAAT